jgi:TRAP-type mannitol/chloroaromatic compound transport system permease large subunit
MIEVSPEAIAAIMLGGFFVGVFSGYPLAFVLGTVGFFWQLGILA